MPIGLLWSEYFYNPYVGGPSCLSNKVAERALRGIALERNLDVLRLSWRRATHRRHVQPLATAKMTDVGPQTWLAVVLALIAAYPAHRLVAAAEITYATRDDVHLPTQTAQRSRKPIPFTGEANLHLKIEHLA
jgi:hypothetical protein